jgi:hypothetical protein
LISGGKFSLCQLLAFFKSVVAESQKTTTVPKPVTRAQSRREFLNGRCGKQLVPFAPLGHGFESKVLIKLPPAIGSPKDLVLIRTSSVATLSTCITIAVIRLSVEQVDVPVATLGQMERRGKAKDPRSNDYYFRVIAN